MQAGCVPIFAVTKKSIVLVQFIQLKKLILAMKNLASFKSNAKLSQKEMQTVKGGFSIVIEKQIDICFQGHSGNLYNVYCDRRRRRVGNAN